MSTVAIVSTVRRPGRDIRGFLDANFAAGISRAYLFFDDPDDPDLQFVKGDARVVPLPVTKSLHQAQRTKFPEIFCWGDYATEVMARQIVNATWALELSRQEGIDWLVHIDADEILYAPGTTL